MSEKSDEYRQRYMAAGHRLQSALKFELEHVRGVSRYAYEQSIFSAKHMRVGIDLRASDALGLFRLLLAKGVFTEDEYLEAMAVSAEEEAQSQIERIRDELGLHPGRDFA